MLKLDYTEGSSTKAFEKNVEVAMDGHIKHFEKELLKIRTGRAHPSLVDEIKVVCYGNTMNLKDLAAITIPDFSMIVIQPWDKSVIPDIEKAIGQSELGINPINDGNIIRLQLPKMSSARRDDLVKVLQKKIEECRITVRNVRKDFHNLIRESEKTKKISEDSSRRLQDLLQKITDKMIDHVEKIGQKKEDEVKSV